MAQGKVTVNNLNLGQGSFPEIERKALFIGVGATNVGSVLSLNSQSDFDTLLGAADSSIKTQVLAAVQNGGENWQGFAAPIAAPGWEPALDLAMATVSPELVVVCDPATTQLELNDAQAKAESTRTALGRRVIILMAMEGFTGITGWAGYVAAQAALTLDVSAYRVAAVPLLHGNDIGVLAGRLCNRSVSIADSPMRVATGPVLGLGSSPVDNTGAELDDATLASLDANRLSVIQHYVDFPGTYFGTCTLLDDPSGDYQVIENLRVVDKAARAIRVLAIKKIKDRSVNSTAISQSYTKTYLMRPLREMSKSIVVAGIPFPAEIKQPKDDAIVLSWPTPEKLEVYMKVAPFNSASEIVANIILDLSSL